jgi:Ion channel
MLLTLMAGTALLLGSLLSYGMAMTLILHVVVRLIRSGYSGLGFWKHVAVMMIVTLITAVAHLTQIALWAVALLLCGQVSGFETAFYLSAENYTALGYGDIILQGQWRLLGPLEAMNGLLFFGLSTAVLFAVMSHLIVNRLRTELRYARRVAGTSGEVALKRAQNSLSGTLSHAG